MRERRYALSLELPGLTLPQHEPLVRAAEAKGYTDAWTGETGGHDGFTPLALAAAWTERTGVSWAVTSASTGTMLGHVGVHVVNRDLDCGMTGYWLLPRARGRGVATRAVIGATAYAFQHLDLHRIELAHAVENVASCAVAERAGFPHEGTRRDAMRFLGGPWSTEHLHARLVTDPEPRAPL